MDYVATLTAAPRIPPDVTYAWSFKATAGAGNNPSVTFSAPAEPITKVIRTHWYALPDSQWAVEVEKDCLYLLTCKATGCNYAVPPEATAELEVQLVFGGETSIFPMITGVEVETARNATTEKWEVVGQGAFRRNAHFTATYGGMYPESEFIDKVIAHEDHHVAQMTSIAPWKDMWDADTFFQDALLGLSDEFEGSLQNTVLGLISQWYDEQSLIYGTNRCEMEWQACQVGNQVAPPYMNFRKTDVPDVWQCEF